MWKGDLEGSAQLILERLGEDEIDCLAEEAQRVLYWRIEQFRSLGFGAVHSVLLAYRGADVGYARNLIAADCPKKLAAALLF
jgi:hypothetical protein